MSTTVNKVGAKKNGKPELTSRDGETEINTFRPCHPEALPGQRVFLLLFL